MTFFHNAKARSPPIVRKVRISISAKVM